MKHHDTPTPLIIRYVKMPTGSGMYRIYDNTSARVCNVLNIYDADFIVRACNAYSELVALARDVTTSDASLELKLLAKKALKKALAGTRP